MHIYFSSPLLPLSRLLTKRLFCPFSCYCFDILEVQAMWFTWVILDEKTNVVEWLMADENLALGGDSCYDTLSDFIFKGYACVCFVC